MGVGAGLYMYDVVVKRSRLLSHLMVSSCYLLQKRYTFVQTPGYCETKRCHNVLGCNFAEC